MKNLIGKKITGIYVNEDSSILKFTVLDGPAVMYQTYGDCCSESWFSDIEFPHYGFLNSSPEVTAVEEIPIPYWLQQVIAKDGRTRQEEDRVYGFTIETSRGDLGIVFRNSSNGYYGGEIDEINEAEHREQCKLDEQVWTKIEEDWTSK